MEHLADNAFDGLTVINKINLDGNRLTTLGKAFHVLPHEVTCGMEVEFPYWFINLDNNNIGSKTSKSLKKWVVFLVFDYSKDFSSCPLPSTKLLHW